MGKEGLRNDLRSHVCWHVYGLFHRQYNNYEQAVKCYKSALRIDEGNMAILKDLSLLQIQIRDMVGFAESRQKIKELHPKFKANWISLAIAKELNSDYELALETLQQSKKEIKEENEDKRWGSYQESELLLFTCMIHEKAE